MDGFADMSSSLLRGANATTPLNNMIGKVPGLDWIQKLISQWVKLDITAIAATVTILGTVSGVLKFLQTVAVKIYWWIARFFTASVSISARDKLNREVLNWIGAEILTRQGTRMVTARSEKVESDAFYYRRKPETRIDYEIEQRQPIEYLPTFGTTWFTYEWNLFLVRRVPVDGNGVISDNTVPNEYAAAPEGTEPLVVMCLGRSVAPIKRFLDMCREFGERQRHAYVTVRASRSYYDEVSWETTILRPIRPMETVHFDEATKASLIADVRNYLDPATRRFYNARGIPYRRGYLMHGPAGTGKTSLSLALAGLFGLELYLMHIPTIRGDTSLQKLFTTLPPRCFVLLEDIDTVGITNREKTKLHKNTDNHSDGDDSDDGESEDDDDDDEDYRHTDNILSSVTLSGFLNALDGVASQEGRIVLMTSNFAERLDRALVRPGRIDRMIYLGFISQQSAELMFKRMYKREDYDNNNNNNNNNNNDNVITTTKNTGQAISQDDVETLARSFGSRLKGDMFTPAQLQGYLLHHYMDPQGAVEGLEAWMADEMAQMAQMEKAKKLAARRSRRRKR